jgi:hypothetical protein
VAGERAAFGLTHSGRWKKWQPLRRLRSVLLLVLTALLRGWISSNRDTEKSGESSPL